MAAMITTENNPFDPREDFPSWHAWDMEHGYFTCAYLDRVTNLATDMPQIMQDRQTEDAIDEIISAHDGKFYIKLPLNTASS